MALRRRRVVGFLGVTLVVLIAGAALWARQNRARPVSIEEARERPTSSTTSVPGDDRPEPGVYEYEGSGTDQLSLPPLTQRQGPTIPGTVELLPDDCFRFRADYSTNHWQAYEYCHRTDGLEEVRAETLQRWIVGAAAITNVSRSACDAGTMFLPTSRREGQEWPARCVVTNDTIAGETVSAGAYRFVGEQRLAVGGTSVATLHFLRLRQYSGGQRGTERIDLWIAAGTGLPIRNRRTVDVKTDTPFGTSHYEETGEYRLTSLTPVR